MNRLIQGSSADQTKTAIIECAKKGYLPIVQIHDELCFNIKDDKDIEEIKREMESCVELIVPSVVDVAIGDDFGQAT